MIEILKDVNVTIAYEVITLLRKDSLDMTDDDHTLIYETIESGPSRRIVVTNGTDNMMRTVEMLQDISGKTIVLTGTMQSAKFRLTDAIFYIACAITAVQTLPYGVYIAMNSHVFDPDKNRKNIAKNCFEAL